MTDRARAVHGRAQNAIVVYQPDEALRLDVRLENDTVWLNRRQMAQLFARDIKTIGKHIANALSEELATLPVVAIFATTAADGKTYQVEHYNLDVILSVGYRVKSAQGILFRRWANAVLKDYLLRGYAFNQRLAHLEDKVDRRLADHDRKIAGLEEKVDFFVQTSLPPVRGVFYDGQVFDAKAFAARHVWSARKSILLIDNWVDVATLELLSKKAKGVAVEIVTSRKGNKLSPGDIAAFNKQYGGLSVRESANFHDRFLVIDAKTLYVIGASLKDMGRKCFAFTKLDSAEIAQLKARI